MITDLRATRVGEQLQQPLVRFIAPHGQTEIMRDAAEKQSHDTVVLEGLVRERVGFRPDNVVVKVVGFLVILKAVVINCQNGVGHEVVCTYIRAI